MPIPNVIINKNNYTKIIKDLLFHNNTNCDEELKKDNRVKQFI